MTISSATPAALAQPQPISQQLPATQAEWTQFSATLNQWLQYLSGPELAFTPSLVGTGGGAPVYTSQLGVYRREGSYVNFTARIDFSSAGTLAGNLSLAGLPVSSQSAISVGTLFPVFASGFTFPGSNYVVVGYNDPGSTNVRFIAQGGTSLQASQIASPSVLIMSGSYPT